MKKLVLASIVAATTATGAFAGGTGGKYADPVIEPAVIVEDTRKSAAGIVVPLLLLVVVAAAIAAK